MLMHIYETQKNGTGTYLQGRNRDIENRLVDIVGEGAGGTNQESIIETYTLP